MLLSSRRASLIPLILLALLGSCGEPLLWQDILYKTSQPLEIRVAYAEGAVPYFGGNGAANSWSVLGDNIGSMFPDRSYNLPQSIDDLLDLGDSGKRAFTDEEVAILIQKIPGRPSTLRILIISGTSTRDEYAVSAIYYPKTNAIAVFQGEFSSPLMSPERLHFLTILNIVHEFGHSIGLVDSGVPMVKNHAFPADAPISQPLHHCFNSTCVMSQNSRFYQMWNSYATWQAYRDNPQISRSMFDVDCRNDVAAHAAHQMSTP